jgi:hypothetical protein
MLSFSQGSEHMKRSVLIGAGIALLALAALLAALNFLSRPQAGRLALQVEVKPAIMSAAYKVYANRETSDGRYWLAKVVLRNDGKSPLMTVRTSFQIPGLVGWTTPRSYPEILPGQTIVALFYPHFPDSLASKTTGTTEQVEFRVEYEQSGQTKQETRQADFQLRPRNDMIYTTIPDEELLNTHDWYENTDMFAAFVTPDDPVIKYFVQQLEQKVMGGTTVGAGADPQEVLRFMHAVYAFWVADGMVYAGTEGLPEKTGTTTTMIQHVRLPREVMNGEAGLCIELSALFASIAEAAGLEPVIVTTGHHAWPAIKVGDSFIPIEATAIGTPGMGEHEGPATFEQAVKIGQKNMQIWMQGGDSELGAAIGVFDLAELHHKGIVPPELPDDPVLRQKIDDTFARLLKGSRTSRRPAAAASEPAREPAPAGEPRSAPTGWSKYSDPHGFFDVAIPAAWSVAATPFPQAPWYALQAGDPAQGIAIEVYVFVGVTSAEEAIGRVQSYVASGGGVLIYQPGGTANIGGRTFQGFTGLTTFPARGAASEWDCYVRTSGGRTIIFTASAPQGRLAGSRPLLQQVAGTFRVSA